MALTIGQAAPAFKLFNSEKEEVALTDFLGKKVIIHFFIIYCFFVFECPYLYFFLDLFAKINAFFL